MITPKKLLSLPPETRIRKLVRLLAEWEALGSGVEEPSRPPKAAAGLLACIEADPLPEETRRFLEEALRGLAPGAPQDEALPWKLNRLRASLLSSIGRDQADWDFRVPGTRDLDPAARTVLPIRLYLDGLRSPFNVGSVFRTAECFGAAEVLLAPGTADPGHPRAAKSSRGSTAVLPYRFTPLTDLSGDETIFALESGGTDIEKFSFPPSGTCILGSEELGISPEARRRAEQSRGIVTVPLLGAKGSLNVSVAAGILLHAWSRAAAKAELDGRPYPG